MEKYFWILMLIGIICTILCFAFWNDPRHDFADIMLGIIAAVSFSIAYVITKKDNDDITNY